MLSHMEHHFITEGIFSLGENFLLTVKPFPDYCALFQMDRFEYFNPRRKVRVIVFDTQLLKTASGYRVYSASMRSDRKIPERAYVMLAVAEVTLYRLAGSHGSHSWSFFTLPWLPQSYYIIPTAFLRRGNLPGIDSYFTMLEGWPCPRERSGREDFSLKYAAVLRCWMISFGLPLQQRPRTCVF